MSIKTQKIKNYRFGLFAEFITCCFLRLKGYKILEQRYKTKLGEVDIIALKSDNLCFVEVKARKKVTDEVLTGKQKYRIIDAAKHYISKKVQYNGYNYRFDLIIFHSPISFKHIISAWNE